MNQSRYIDKILERFGMVDCKARATPSEIKCDLTPEGDQTDQRKYRGMLGSLIYIMTCTRLYVRPQRETHDRFKACVQVFTRN